MQTPGPSAAHARAVMRTRPPARALGALIVCAAVCACATDPLSTTVASTVCTSEIEWTGGDQASPLMHPGEDCVSCHSRDGGPPFAAAGTVYKDRDAADNCFGDPEAQVVLRGSDGVEFKLAVNSAGNFYLDTSAAGSLKLPYTAKVTSGGKTVEMTTPQTLGSCNSCHGAAGSGGAPGRISAQ